KKAIQATHQYLKKHNLDLKIEVETRNLNKDKEVLEVGGVDFIMLENMDYDMMRAAVDVVGDTYKPEASGEINEETQKDVAECGVNFISVGALTHHVKSMDISLKAIN